MEYDYSYPPYIITNLVAIVVIVTALQWPTISRILLGVTFLTAFVVNLFTAIYDPNAYLEFGKVTTSDVYRSIIAGPFSHHTRLYIVLIAVGQLFIGIFTMYKGKLMNIAMTGGMLFLFAIAPLGFGSAFPSSIIMGMAFVFLLFRKIDLDIYDTIRR